MTDALFVMVAAPAPIGGVAAASGGAPAAPGFAGELDQALTGADPGGGAPRAAEAGAAQKLRRHLRRGAGGAGGEVPAAADPAVPAAGPTGGEDPADRPELVAVAAGWWLPALPLPMAGGDDAAAATDLPVAPAAGAVAGAAGRPGGLPAPGGLTALSAAVAPDPGESAPAVPQSAHSPTLSGGETPMGPARSLRNSDSGGAPAGGAGAAAPFAARLPAGSGGEQALRPESPADGRRTPPRAPAAPVSEPPGAVVRPASVVAGYGPALRAEAVGQADGGPASGSGQASLIRSVDLPAAAAATAGPWLALPLRQAPGPERPRPNGPVFPLPRYGSLVAAAVATVPTTAAAAGAPAGGLPAATAAVGAAAAPALAVGTGQPATGDPAAATPAPVEPGSVPPFTAGLATALVPAGRRPAPAVGVAPVATAPPEPERERRVEATAPEAIDHGPAFLSQPALRGEGHQAAVARPEAPVRAQEIIDQLARHARLTQSGGETHLQVRLQPESLGEVTLRVTLAAGGGLHGNVTVSHPAVREALLGALPELRQSLSEQGMRVESFTVNVGAEPGGREHRPPPQPQRPWRSEPVQRLPVAVTARAATAGGYRLNALA